MNNLSTVLTTIADAKIVAAITRLSDALYASDSKRAITFGGNVSPSFPEPSAIEAISHPAKPLNKIVRKPCCLRKIIVPITTNAPHAKRGAMERGMKRPSAIVA